MNSRKNERTVRKILPAFDPEPEQKLDQHIDNYPNAAITEAAKPRLATAGWSVPTLGTVGRFPAHSASLLDNNSTIRVTTSSTVRLEVSIMTASWASVNGPTSLVESTVSRLVMSTATVL